MLEHCPDERANPQCSAPAQPEVPDPCHIGSRVQSSRTELRVRKRL